MAQYNFVLRKNKCSYSLIRNGQPYLKFYEKEHTEEEIIIHCKTIADSMINMYGVDNVSFTDEIKKYSPERIYIIGTLSELNFATYSGDKAIEILNQYPKHYIIISKSKFNYINQLNSTHRNNIFNIIRD